jgi:hypothetical protein
MPSDVDGGIARDAVVPKGTDYDGGGKLYNDVPQSIG